VKDDLTTEQSLLVKKKKECDEVTVEIDELNKNLMTVKDEEKTLSDKIIYINQQLVVASQIRKDAKKGEPKNAAKSEEDRLTRLKQEQKAALAAVRAKITHINADKITQDKDKDKKNTFIAGLLSKITILENKFSLAVQNELAKVHTKSTNVIGQINSWFLSKFGPTGAKLGGNKPNKSRQNKQRYQRKYTKRIQKKIYRKKTLKRFKIKRPKRTKKYRGK
jgi:hypothetical protein